MVEHAVQQDADAPLRRLGAEGPEILLRAQHGINFRVVRRVVAVVGRGLKNGAEVEGGNAQGLQVVQMGGHARQGAAEEVPVFDLAVLRLPGGGVVPVLVDPAAADKPLRAGEAQTAVAVRKNLIGHALAKPGGGAAFLINRELPGDGFPLAAVTSLVQEAPGAVVPPEAEPVPGQFRRLEGNQGEGKAGPVLLEAGEGHLRLHLVPGKFPADDDRTMGESLAGQGAAGEGPLLPAGEGAVGLLVPGIAGVKDGRCVHEKNSLFVKIRGSNK